MARLSIRRQALLDAQKTGTSARDNLISKHFKFGDHVRWNSEAGYVSGVIRKIQKHDFTWKGYKRHCSEDEPQYETESDKTDHVAIHKGAALKRMGS